MKISLLPEEVTAVPTDGFFVFAYNDKNYKVKKSLISGESLSIHADIEFEVGVDTGAMDGISGTIPIDGDSTVELDSSITRIRIIRNNVPQSLSLRSGYKYSFDSGTHVLTFTPELVDDLIQIQPY